MTFGKIFGWLSAVAIALFVIKLVAIIIQGGAEQRAALEKHEAEMAAIRAADEKAEQEKKQAEVTAARVKAEKIALCNANMPTFAKEIQQAKDNGRCLANTKLTPPRMCALHDRESEMCMGDEAGLVCKSSPKGAEGCFQFMPDTCYGAVVTNKKGKKVKLPGVCVDGNGDGKIKANSFADSSLSAVYYLCALEKKVGPDNMFKAYNGGAVGYIAAITDTTAYSNWIEEHAATYAQGSNPVSGSMMASANPQATTSAGTPTANNGIQTIPAPDRRDVRLVVSPIHQMVTPISEKEGTISSIEGEPRSHGPHLGIDDSAALGTPLYAPADGGIVIRSDWQHGEPRSERAGFYVHLEYNTKTKADGTLAAVGYSHLQEKPVPVLRKGETVSRGMLIGYVGRTAVLDPSTPTHLHLQVWRWEKGQQVLTDPFDFFNFATHDPNSSFYAGPLSREQAKGLGDKFKRIAASHGPTT